ncbi:MAG: hypothetical protein QW607_10170 [Desulfurococcaceae archaeon]
MKWDRGLDYETIYIFLLRKMKNKTLKQRIRCYIQILLIQLRNGSRISEAVRCYKQFLTTGERELNIEVSKKKKKETRLMIIPPEIEVDETCYELLHIDDKKLINRIKTYASQKLKINTHSLRYAFITYLLRNGVNPAIVSKIIKHSKLDFILTYTQEKLAQEILKHLL